MSPQVCWGMHCLPGSVSPITIPGDRPNDQLVVWKVLLTTTIHMDIGNYKAQSIRASIAWIAWRGHGTRAEGDNGTVGWTAGSMCWEVEVVESMISLIGSDETQVVSWLQAIHDQTRDCPWKRTGALSVRRSLASTDQRWGQSVKGCLWWPMCVKVAEILG